MSIQHKLLRASGSKCRTVDVCDIFGDNSGKALYRLDGNANDESGNYHGTETAIAYGGGVYERGAVLNGTSSVISVTANASAVSLSFWINTPINTTYSKGVLGGGANGCGLYCGNASSLFANETLTIFGSAPDTRAYITDIIDDTSWKHIVMIYNGVNNYSIYLNGTSRTVYYSGSCSSFINLITSIGYANTNYYLGSIDQIRIFNRAITATEVATLYAECAPTSIVDNINPFEDGSLKALYQFNGDATDKTGVYNGTATNVTYGTGKFGQCAVFNGTSSYVTNIIKAPDKFSISVWVKHTSFGTYQTYYDNNIDETGTKETVFRAQNTATGILIRVSSGSSFQDAAFTHSMVTNTWYLLTATVDGSVIKFYQDGVLKGTVTQTVLNTNLATTGLVGARKNILTNLMNGSIDQLRIFNKALTPMEVASLYNETTPLEEPMHSLVDPFKDGSGKALYRLDGNALDESGNYNGTATSVTYGAGRFGRAGVFNGTSSQIVCPNFAGYRALSVWASKATSGTQLAIVGGADESWFGFSDASDSNMKISINATVGVQLPMLSALTLNVVYHFVLVWETSTSLKLYRDGVLQTTITVANYQTTSMTYIGRRNTTLWHNGSIEQLRQFNKALIQAEVTALYNEI